MIFCRNLHLRLLTAQSVIGTLNILNILRPGDFSTCEVYQVELRANRQTYRQRERERERERERRYVAVVRLTVHVFVARLFNVIRVNHLVPRLAVHRSTLVAQQVLATAVTTAAL